MSNKNITLQYESGKLHGIYRCKKRTEILGKIPSVEKEELPDITGLIISGIKNFGNDPEMIRNMAAETLGCNADDIKIPYENSTTARKQFINEAIIGKLTGNIAFSTESLVQTFYEFLDMPTEATKNLLIQDDVRDMNRYIHCEQRKPVVVEQPVLHIGDVNILCQLDYVFASMQTIKTNKRKEKNKWVYDTENVLVLEAVRLFPGKPKVKENSKILDAGVNSRLEMYVMLKAMENLYQSKKELQRDCRVVFRASYYYLQKDRESEANYKPDFFGTGGNVVCLQVFSDGMKDMDEFYLPQLEQFLDGMSVDKEKCKNCKSKAICTFAESATPLDEEEKKRPEKLPVLSMAQEQAATALSGNIRVIATAGSGKTTAMAYRIMNLLKAGVKPEKIGCFTFTNAGAGEMMERIKGFCQIANIDADVDKITISTLHSFGDTLLKKYYTLLGYTKPPVLINEVQKTSIIEEILSQNKPIDELMDKYRNFYMDMFREKGILEFMKDCFSIIMKGISQEDFKDTTGLSDNAVDEIYNMYMKYDKRKKAECLIEHDDQELGIFRLLRVKPDLFEEVGIEHISVDEYQDTSDIQFQIIDAMRQAPQVKSLFIVGDDDQSIYGFRNANVKLIKDFFGMIQSDGLDVQLMENRRSTGNIVEFAARLIRNNEDRMEKHPVSTNEDGIPVSVAAFADKNDEQNYIIDSVETMLKSGYRGSDIAILTMTNQELLSYAEILREKGIESVSINPEPIIDNCKVRGAISLVHFLLNTSELDGTTFLNAKETGALILEEKKDIRVKLEELREQVKEIKSVTDLFAWFKELDPDETDEIYQSFLEDVNIAMENAVKQENLHKVCQYILDFERFGQKQTARKEKAYNGVVLSTMHSSKGKEWPVVFCSVTKMHNRDLKVEDIPEKNRLLFVACTRAKKELYITGVDVAYNSASYGAVSNMFLEECMRVEDGMRREESEMVS